MIDSDDSFHTSDNSSIKTTSIIITSPSLPFTTSQPSSSFIPDVLNSTSQTSSEMLPSTPSTKSSLLSDSGKESSHQCSVVIYSSSLPKRNLYSYLTNFTTLVSKGAHTFIYNLSCKFYYVCVPILV